MHIYFTLKKVPMSRKMTLPKYFLKLNIIDNHYLRVSPKIVAKYFQIENYLAYSRPIKSIWIKRLEKTILAF